MKPHPKSIALAQSAMESSWATSRFFRAAKNVFGVWSFDKQDSRIEALKKRGNKTVWVKKYPTLEASIRDYYRTIARGKAFGEFRKLKMETDDPFKLVKKLDRYSEKGAAYGKELAAVIRQNNFTEYDD
jgi:Bax protein